MLKLSQMEKLGRPVRQDDSAQLGEATADQICDAIDEGRLDDAKALAHYTLTEGKSLHDLFCDWIWDMLTRVAGRIGEQGMFEVLRGSQESWMLRRTWKAFLGMTIRERVDSTMEIMRAHNHGAKHAGAITLQEDAERYSIVMDPCGSGGRMRRGDVNDGTPSRLGTPYEFGSTKEAHDWSWNRKGVPYYCVHCAVNELMPIEWGGHPLWVTEYDDDPHKPCMWHFYKSAEKIPEHYYTRLGKSKPKPGEGQY